MGGASSPSETLPLPFHWDCQDREPHDCSPRPRAVPPQLWGGFGRDSVLCVPLERVALLDLQPRGVCVCVGWGGEEATPVTEHLPEPCTEGFP